MAAQGPNEPHAKSVDPRPLHQDQQNGHATATEVAQPVDLEFLQRAFPLSATVKRLLTTAQIALGRKPPTISIASFLHSAATHSGSSADKDVSTSLFGPAARENRFDRLLDVSAPPVGRYPEVVVSPAMQAAIAYADEIRRTTRLANTQVRRRYVVLAILAPRLGPIAEELDEVLAATGVDGNVARYEIARYCMTTFDRNDNRAEWDRLLAEWGLTELQLSGKAPTPGMGIPSVTQTVPPPIATPTDVPPSPTPVMDVSSNASKSQPPPLRATVPAGVPLCEPDDPWAHNLIDRAGASREARAFSRMILARQFKPPLAVGVFGDWGSGKSFFMRLVHEEIERGPAILGAQGATGPISFLSNIVQIRFNAWHYAETNLWASLVDHIFRELDGWAERREPKLADRLFEQLATARQLTVESAELLVKRRRERDAAASTLKSAQSELDKKRAAVEQSQATLIDSVWLDLYGSAGLELKTHAARLGIDTSVAEANELRSTLKELDEEAGRSALYRTSLLHTLGRPLTVLSLVVGALVLPLLIEAVATFLHVPLKPATAAVSGIAATMTGALGWANGGVSRALSYFRSLGQQFDKKVRVRTAEAQEAADVAAAELQSRETAVGEASEHLDVATIRVTQAIRDYHSQTGRGRVLRFVRERVTDGDYAKQLGFVATVRKDFEELDSLMREPAETAADTAEAREKFAEHVDRVINDAGTALNDEEKKKLKATTIADDVGRVFERIVLYVDDLDRCPPGKVVDVLQAVHLLLTFPLFVVFVAVDVRWLRQALASHYTGQLTLESESTSATAGDYLEKIFQVPYWVRPMDEEGTRSILRDRIGPEPAEPAEMVKVREGRSDATAETVARTDTDVGAVDKPNGKTPSTAQSSSDRRDGSLELSANALTFTRREHAFIQKIAAVLDGSPRRTLRFINTYRVLKASLPEAEVGSVEQSDYAGLLTLLALSIAANGAYPKIVQAIEAARLNQQPAGANLEMLPNVSAADLDRIRRAYQLFAIEGGDSNSLTAYARLVGRFTFCPRTF